MSDSFCIPAAVVLEPLYLPWLEPMNIKLAVLRLDKTDAFISGNKWFKLHYHLKKALENNAKGLISVGGPYSNHLHALAVAGKNANLPTVGLLRGHPQQTATTDDLERFGMTLHWLSYAEYRQRYQPEFWQEWLNRYVGYYPIPEGGTGILGAKGCSVIPELIKQQLPTVGWTDYDVVYASVGTGSTLSGIIWGEEGKHQAVGCLAVPAKYGVEGQIKALLSEIAIPHSNYQLIAACRKGFGQVDDELLAFMAEVEHLTGLLLDPVYTAKTLYCIKQQVLTGQIAEGSRIVFVHTGGLQGRRALISEE